MKKLIDEDTCDTSVKHEEGKKCNEMLRKHNRFDRKKNLRDKLFMAHGVKIMDCGSTNETGHDTGPIQVRNGLLDRISKDLKKRVFKYRSVYDLFAFTGLRDYQRP